MKFKCIGITKRKLFKILIRDAKFINEFATSN